MSYKEEIVEFPFLIPPDWCEKMKCPSKERYIAFYWNAKNDEIVWNDGNEEGINGNEVTNAWLSFMRQGIIEHFLCRERIHFGFCDSTATHWLLYDTKNRQAYAVPVQIIGKILKKQNLRNIAIDTRASNRQC